MTTLALDLEVCIDMCIDMRIDMCIGTCIDLLIDMWIDMRIDMCIDMYDIVCATSYPYKDRARSANTSQRYRPYILKRA